MENNAVNAGIQFTPTNSTDEELEQYGRQQASKTAGSKGSLAGKTAGSAARQQGGSKLFAALQAAQAANEAVQGGFEEEANAAKGIKLTKEQQENDRAFNKAAQEFEAKTAKEAAEKEREFQKEEARKQREFDAAQREKDRHQSLLGMGIQLFSSFW